MKKTLQTLMMFVLIMSAVAVQAPQARAEGAIPYLFVMTVGAVVQGENALAQLKQKLSPIQYEQTAKIMDSMKAEMGDDFYTIAGLMAEHAAPEKLAWIQAKGPASKRAYAAYALIYVAAQ